MGAGSSKASAAQKSVSRTAAAAAAKPTVPPPPSAAAAASPAEVPAAGIHAAEQRRAEELRARAAADPGALPAEQRSENEILVAAMNKAMAGMRQYQYEVYRNPQVDALYALKKKTKEEKEAELVGRLASPALKSLLEEHARATAAGRPPDVAELARRYGADAEVLQRFLQHNSLPVVHTARDGRLVGSWPDGRDE